MLDPIKILTDQQQFSRFSKEFAIAMVFFPFFWHRLAIQCCNFPQSLPQHSFFGTHGSCVDL